MVEFATQQTRRRRRMRIMAAAIAILTLSVGALIALGVWQLRAAVGVFRSREQLNLDQLARLAARECAALIAQDDARLLNALNPGSAPTLALSLSQIDRNHPDVLCFALWRDGRLLYPPPLPAPSPRPTATGAYGVDRLPAGVRDQWFARARETDGALVILPAGGAAVPVSLYAFNAGETNGLIGFCWSPSRAEAWCAAVAVATQPRNYGCEIRDAAGRCLAAHPGAPVNPPRQVGTAELPGGLPWTLCVYRQATPELQALFRGQALFYAAALAIALVLIGAAVSVLVAVTLREAELARIKADFAATVAHELRTPLALIRASAETLATRDGLDSAQVRRYGGIIDRESRRLTDLVTNVLHIVALGRRKRAHRMEPLELGAFVGTFVEEYAEHARAAGATLMAVRAEAPVWVRADEAALRLVLINLLDNAIKFSPDDKRVEIATAATEREARLSVRDHGVGIAPGDLERVCQPFFRAETDLVKKTRGAGIGLALVREIVAAHGGRVDVTSALGAGTTVLVALPLGSPPRAPDAPKGAA